MIFYLYSKCNLAALTAGIYYIPNMYSESSLLKKFQKYKALLNREKEKLIKEK